MINFNDNPIVQNYDSVETNNLISKVFFRMFLGLLATALIAAYTYYSGFLEDFIARGGYVFCIAAELIVVLVFSLGFRKLSPIVVTILYYAYAMLTGLTFASIFAVFELQSIVYAFLGTAAVFGIMAYIGKNTKADLTSMGTILTISLIVAIVVSIINIFIGNSLIDIILDWVMIFIFMGFTVYDMNKIVSLQDVVYADSEKLYIYGAMQLYLDFINLFIRILYIFGKRRD